MLKKNLQIFLGKGATTAIEPWLDALTLTQKGSTLHVCFPHSFFGPWFERYKKKEFEAAVAGCFPDFTAIVYNTCTEQFPGLLAQLHEKNREKGQTRGPEKIRQKNTFENFFYNEKNSFPLTILSRIAQQPPGSIYSPVLLCGTSGSGKTHLLQAVAKSFTRQNVHVFLANHPSSLSETAELSSLDVFWRRYSALFIDDIQELAASPELQRLLVRFMDSRPSASQLFFSLTGDIKNLESFDERLKTRLSSGLILELLQPDIDVRLRFLEKLCQQEKIQLSKKQMLYLAQRCNQYRNLQGTVLKIAAMSSVQKRPVSQVDIAQALSEGSAEEVVGYQEIMKQVAQMMQVSVEEILGTHRQNNLVLARQLAMYVCRSRLGLSYPELGRIFGGKDHSTVIHAIKKIEHLLLTNTDINNLVTQLTTSP